MKILRISVVAASLAIGAVPQMIAPSFAEDAPSPETLQAAREFASLSSGSVVSQIATNLTNEVWPTVETALRVKNPTIDATTLAALRREFEQLQVKAIDDAMQNAAPIYARHFTVEELRQLIAFYRSPVGIKALNVMPQASLEVLQGLGPGLQQLSETVNQRFAAILQEHGYKP